MMLYQFDNSHSMNNGNLNSYKLGDANIIYVYKIMNKTKDQIVSETGVWKGTVNSLIKRFKKKWGKEYTQIKEENFIPWSPQLKKSAFKSWPISTLSIFAEMKTSE